MLKVVVFDNGYGGEFFADLLKEELPVIEIIRVIDWRHAKEIQESPRKARQIAKNALRPYIGKVDLIIFANYLLSLTSVNYFCRHYKNQRFIGINLKKPDSSSKKDVILLTTKAVTKTVGYYSYLLRNRRKTKTVVLESWPTKIDDGELTKTEIEQALRGFIKDRCGSKEVVLGCSQFYDVKPELKNIFGHNLKIYDGFNETIREVCKTLKVRGSAKKIK